jgi:tripartite-type tricarboxylate transporter receptor subunit TctC
MRAWTSIAVRAAVAAVLACAPCWAPAQYPDRPITMVVPFPPGGVADTVARPVAEALARELKVPVVIENRTGAGGSVGMSHAARAAPDGHTILLALSSISILPEADKLFERKPAFTLGQFKPIARFTADPTVLVVRADAPWKTLGEFVADARRRPGAYNYGSSGNYGTMHVPMEMLKSAAGFRMVHIPYTGAGPAVIALLGGQVDALASGPSTVAQHIRSGRLRALAHWGDKPLAALPEVPSLASQNLNVKFAQWSGLFVPSDTPRFPRRAGAADHSHGGQPGRVSRCARVPGLLGCRRRADGAGGAADRQGRVTGALGRGREAAACTSRLRIVESCAADRLPRW